ncbi:hypothetical protein ACEWY4_025018 [Coilia grayii]|uniref:Fibronectin type-III domain-containing protein n=1 Tax=Coilia grayii TaxID=363190 RepID=A0ABD1IWE5_9TELE
MLWTLTNADSAPCDVRLRSLDFFGVLEWNCSGLLPNVTFTVKIRRQGRNEHWHNVEQCVGISSGSCNLSREITDFTDYVQLGVEEQPGHIRWAKIRQCYLQGDAPSLEMRVVKTEGGSGRSQIGVNVTFPCAPKALEHFAEWNNGQSCCPITKFLDNINVRVTLFNKQQLMDRQTRLGSVIDGNIDEFTFGGVLPGQEYCAVANFTRSAASQPVCRQLDPRPEGLLEPVSVCPVLGEGSVRLSADDDTPSLISLCSCDLSQPVTQLPPPCSPLHQYQAQYQDQDHQYYSNPLTELPVRDTTHSDSGGLVQEGPEVPLAPLFLDQGSEGMAVQMDGAPQLWEGFTYLADNPGIPLSSLRLGLGELDEGLYLNEELMEQSGCMVSTWMEDDETYHSETVGGGGGIFLGEAE